MPQKKALPSIGIIGFGDLGRALAQAFTGAGYPVQVTSRSLAKQLAAVVTRIAAVGPLRIPKLTDLETASALADTLGVSTGTSESTANLNDIVVLAVPFTAMRKLVKVIGPLVRDKIVIDAMNAQTDKVFKHGSSADVRTFLSPARVIKVFNTVPAKTLARPPSKLVAIPIAGDDAKALEQVSVLVRAIAFAPLVVGELSEGKRFGPGTKAFACALSETALVKALGVSST